MAGTKKLDDLKNKIEDLRSVVTGGFERLVEHELNGLKKHYKEVQKSLKAARKAGDVKKAAKMQLEMLQTTIDRILENLHETAGIISDTRAELTKLTEGKPAAKPAKKVAAKPAAAPAKKAAAKPAAKSTATRAATAAKKTTAKASTAAKKTTARASTAAKKTATRASTAAKKTTAKATTAAKSTTARASTAAKKTATRASAAAKKTTTRASTAAKKTATKATTAAKSATAVKPSPTSRVKRATSQGKATTGSDTTGS